MLTEAIKEEGIDGLTLLDIGGGVGAIQHELLEAGVQDVTSNGLKRRFYRQTLVWQVVVYTR